MNCAACTKCREDPNNPGRCIYGGPFQFVKAEPIDEAAYINTAYGEALPPVFINGQWRSQYRPWGNRYGSWQEVLDDLRNRP